jgi:hypothetical protein
VAVVLAVEVQVVMIDVALTGLAEQRIADRPESVKPRAIKRRPAAEGLRHWLTPAGRVVRTEWKIKIHLSLLVRDRRAKTAVNLSYGMDYTFTGERRCLL